MTCRRLILLAFALVALSTHFCSGAGYSKPQPRMEPPSLCYDCDYDPDEQETGEGQGHKGQGQGHWGMWASQPGGYGNGKKKPMSGEEEGADGSKAGPRGFPQCALDGSTDEQKYVRLTVCHSGTCFIRRDHNGLVYRGCADSRNLPLGVDSSAQCRAQGLRPAVWWFCNGTMCNSDPFSTVCADTDDKADSAGNMHPTATHYGPVPFNNPYIMRHMMSMSSPSSAAYPSHQSAVAAESTMSGSATASKSSSSYSGSHQQSSAAATSYGRPPTPEQNHAASYSAGSGMSGGHQFQMYMPTGNSASSGSSYGSGAAAGSQPFQVYMPAEAPSGYGSNAGEESGSGTHPSDDEDATNQHESSQSSTYWGTASMGYGSQSNGNEDDQKTGPSYDDEVDDELTYRAWDFLLLAKSRLERLSSALEDAAMSHEDSMNHQQQQYGSSSGSHEAAVNGGERPSMYDMTHGSMRPGHFMSSSGYGSTNEDSGGDDDDANVNPCDHVCLGNPSALFADPGRVDGFIQCGPGLDAHTGLACHCCRPHRMHCPASTSFDPVAKVCSAGDGGDGERHRGNGASHHRSAY